MNFLSLSRPSDTRVLAEWSPGVRVEPITCALRPEHRRGGKRLGPLSLVVANRATPHFLWTWYGECLVRVDVVDVLRDERITGWQVRRAGVADAGGEPLDAEYWELIVTGWGGIAPPASGVRLLERCPVCGHAKYSCFDQPSVLMHADAWDHSDIFMVWPLPGYVLVDERTTEVIRRAGFTGAVLLAISALKCTAGLTPGRLSDYMPEERAREIVERYPEVEGSSQMSLRVASS